MSHIDMQMPLALATAGCFSLPTIDAEVPVQLTRDQHRVRTLARFAQVSEEQGVSLPGGNFASVEQVVAAQWSQYLTELLGSHAHVLAGRPVLAVTDDALSMVIAAEGDLNCFRLKPIVEALEESLPGLGWFVSNVLRNAGYHGHNIYDMSMVQCLSRNYAMEMDEFSDEGYARALMLDNGQEPPDPIPPELIVELKAEYMFWPSEMIDEVGGWVHLICSSARPKDPSRRPARLSDRDARAWLKAHTSHAMNAVVASALRLKAMLKNDDRSFVWHGPSRDDETDCLGAACFLVWDEAGLLFEAVSHFEQDQYQAGQAVEAYARNVLQLTDEPSAAQVTELVTSCKRYFQRWALLAEVLSSFPTLEDHDET